MNDNYYTLEDFVADDHFRQWVKQPHGPSSRYWHTYLANHPEQADLIQQAADLVRKLSEATAALSESPNAVDEATIWSNIREQVLAQEDRRQSPFLTRHRSTGRRWLMVAASVLTVIGVGWWLQRSYSPQATNKTGQLANTHLQRHVDQTNIAEKPRLISLPDGSSVLLQKGSHLRYPKQFSGGKRMVYLTGEAFFEVAKDAKHPFFVYANELVTKVLGTSFTVKAYASDKNVVVTVRSGRVAVFTQSDKNRNQKISSPTLDGVVLTRNQQLVFARQPVRLSAPKGITPAVARDVFVLNQASFLFDATPVSEVFALLEKTYGISIVYDKETLGKCRLTADLTDEPLADKMLIICKSIEATYTITDTQLAVSGPGCGS
ncbi:FecR domain-containing protein [uncultured Fibrella sp.]|uniref:FecR domain-containing protein n=1 Tax=uncultured Fibrella sp. TaxID=1284596 RepID=UPI0035CBABF7